MLHHSICEGDEIVNQSNSLDYIKIVDQITAKIEERFSKCCNIEPLAGNDRIATWEERPSLEFQIVGPLTKNELRVILIEWVDEFLALINTNEKLRPFLKKFPFTANEIDVGIHVIDENKEHSVFDPYIFRAIARSGKLYFNTLDKKNMYEIKTTEVEDFETAQKILKERNSKD